MSGVKKREYRSELHRQAVQRQLRAQAKAAKDKDLIDSVDAMVKNMRELINDKRHAAYKYALEALAEEYRHERESLRGKAESTDADTSINMEKYAIKCIALDARLDLLYNILRMPAKYEEYLSRLLTEKQQQREKLVNAGTKGI